MIICVEGAPGSGKTTIGKKLSKLRGVEVIDTDDIDDASAMMLIKNPQNAKMFTPKGMTRFFRAKDELNNVTMEALIASATGKIVVVVGLSIEVRADRRFFIKATLDENYRRIILRTMHSMCKHRKGIERLLKSSQSTDKIFATLLHKYELRVGVPVPPPVVLGNLARMEKNARHRKCTVLTADQIYQRVKRLKP